MNELWCHTCGCRMVKRKGKYGEFYGCTGYPVCKNAVNLRDAQLEPDEEDRDEPSRSD